MRLVVQLIIVVGLIGFATDGPKASDCTGMVGQTIELQAPEQVWKRLEGQQLTKDEFETSAQFAARMRQGRQEANRIIAVEGTYDPEYVAYNADTEEFTVAVYAWDNLADGIDTIGGRLNRQVLPSRWDAKASIGLKETEHSDGEYIGQNTFGATEKVTKVRRERYSVYDRILPSKTEWRTETTLKKSSYGMAMDYPAVILGANIAGARAMKINMRVGAVIRPKTPYIATTGRHWGGATINDPREINETTRIIIADILCTVLTDENGRIIKTIDSYRD